jgi:hypothetical protein
LKDSLPDKLLELESSTVPAAQRAAGVAVPVGIVGIKLIPIGVINADPTQPEELVSCTLILFPTRSVSQLTVMELVLVPDAWVPPEIAQV